MRTATLLRFVERRTMGLAAALAASGLLLLVSNTNAQPQPTGPVPVSVAWAKAKTASIPATLPDRTAYNPVMFLDASTSVGTAPTRGGKYLRLVWRGPDGSIRELRRVATRENPYFGNVTAAGPVLAWAEGTRSGRLRLWTVNLTDGRRPVQLTADTGDVLFNDSQYDLSIGDGRLTWIASEPGRNDVVQVRSVALTGGPVTIRRESGTWQLSAWPWLANGAGAPKGTTALRNLATNQNVTVHRRAGLQTTNCNPTWCEVVAWARDGSSQIDLMHPDGTGRRQIADGVILPAITDVTPLNRFEVLALTDPNLDLTHNEQLLVYEIATRRTVQLSLDAATVFYRGGVLWWSNGSQAATVWHTIDLRTV